MSLPPSPLPSTYRSVRPLPNQLLEHATAALEEGLFADALVLLTSTLTSATGLDHVPALLPPPEHLALVATLVVHPNLTTATGQTDRHAAADEALRYLKHVQKLVGPIGARFDAAFQFRDNASSARNSRISRRAEHSRLERSPITSNFADRDALWTNAEDFWSVVGWAFNCSVVHRPRWERWRLWLEFMLDSLEPDLNEYAKDVVSGKSEVKECLLSKYLQPIRAPGTKASKRRLLRAIFADGTSSSLAAFPEVFKHETRPPKKATYDRASKRKTLDLAKGDFGDYYDDEDAKPISSPPHSPKRRRSSMSPSSVSINDSLSDSSSLPLRHRLLHLLSTLCEISPGLLTSPQDFAILLTEILRPLPLREFTSLLYSATPTNPSPSRAQFLQTLIRPMLSVHAPDCPDEAPLTQRLLAKYFAPFAANGTKEVDHAKVALCIEAMLRMLMLRGRGEDRLQWSADLQKAIDRGIDTRMAAIMNDQDPLEKAQLGGRTASGTPGHAAEEAYEAATECHKRMKVMLEMYQL